MPEKHVYSTVLQLRSLQPIMRSYPHAYRGFAMVLDLIRRASPDSAARLHDDAPLKPITISPLARPRADGLPWEVRITVLDDALFGLLVEAIAARDPDEPVRIDEAAFRVERLVTAPGSHRDAACTSFEALVDGGREPEGPWRIRFITPIAFRSKGEASLFPTVPLVFGSLIRKWNQFSARRAPEGLAERLTAGLVVAQYHLRVTRVGFGGFFEPGFTGWCEYSARRSLEPGLGPWVGALADFAFFGGVGAKTSMGMGQARHRGGVSPK